MPRRLNKFFNIKITQLNNYFKFSLNFNSGDFCLTFISLSMAFLFFGTSTLTIEMYLLAFVKQGRAVEINCKYSSDFDWFTVGMFGFYSFAYHHHSNK